MNSILSRKELSGKAGAVQAAMSIVVTWRRTPIAPFRGVDALGRDSLLIGTASVAHGRRDLENGCHAFANALANAVLV